MTTLFKRGVPILFNDKEIGEIWPTKGGRWGYYAHLVEIIPLGAPTKEEAEKRLIQSHVNAVHRKQERIDAMQEHLDAYHPSDGCTCLEQDCADCCPEEKLS